MRSYPEFKKLLEEEPDLQKRERLIEGRGLQYSQAILKAVMPVYGNDIDCALDGLENARKVLLTMKESAEEVEHRMEETDR